jgi:SWI/SNF-related matrix-associated actin-dependent regulator of chromatin subfamily A3
LIEPAPLTDAAQAQIRRDTLEYEDDEAETHSAKIDQLINLLNLTPRTEKSVIFSQFTSFLDKVSDVCLQNKSVHR